MKLKIGPVGVDLNQELTRHIWADAEIRLWQASVKSTKISGIISDLVSSYQGQKLAYDEGLYYGDPILCSALWRNLYVADETVRGEQLYDAITYIRAQLHHLNKTDWESIESGKFEFANTFNIQ